MPVKKTTVKKATLKKKPAKKKAKTEPSFKKKKIKKEEEKKNFLIEEDEKGEESEQKDEEVTDEELAEYFDEDEEEMEEEPKKKKKSKKKKVEIEEEDEEDEEEFVMQLSEQDEKEKSKKPNIDEGLTEIYENEDGSMPDMKNFEKKSHSKLLRALIVLILSLGILGAVAYAGFVIFQPQSQFAEEDVIISISGEEELMIGQAVKYRIRYRNAQSLPLAQSKLQVRFPEGFVMESADPEPTSGKDTWDLGTLAKEESGYIDIEGKMYGALDSEQSFRVFFNYMPSNFSSEFQKVVTQKIKLTQSPFELSVAAPDELAPGVNNDFVVKVSKTDLEDLDIKYLAVMIEGEDFNKTGSEPESDEREEVRWTLPSFEDETEIKITGTFSPKDENIENGKLVAKLVGWKDENREGDGYIFAMAEHEVIFSHTAINLNLVINGSRNNFNVGPGDILSGTLSLKNSGDGTIKNARIKLVIDAPSYNNRSILNWAKRDFPVDGDIVGEQLSEEVRRGTITWTKGYLSDLASLESGEEAVIDFHLPIKTAADTDLTKFTTYDVKITTDVVYDGAEEETLSGNSIDLIINSDLNLEVKDETSISGSGKDVHTVTWLLNNTFHNLEDLKLTADVYGDVSLSEEDFVVPAGKLDFNEELKKLTWTIDQMPTSVDVLALQFDIAINKKNPTQTNLTSKVQLNAADTVTGENIIKVGREILLNEEG